MNETVKRDLAEAREVCPTTTRRLLGEGALLIDVREPSEIAALAFDVPSILAIPLGDLPRCLIEIPRDRQLIMVCKGGARSLKATYFLMYQGYEHIANMSGGIDKWAAKGFPIVGDPTAITTTSTECCCSSEPASTTDGCGGVTPRSENAGAMP